MLLKVELEVKTMFIRYISHEIRNPLNSLQLGLDGLEEDMTREKDSERRMEIMRELKQSLHASLTTLNDMLTSDKIRSGFLALDRKNTSLLPWLERVLERFRTQVRLVQ